MDEQAKAASVDGTPADVPAEETPAEDVAPTEGAEAPAEGEAGPVEG